MRKIVQKTILAVSLSVSISLSAQQDAMYTHYMYNTLSVNPAYAGSRDALTVTALHRSQWVDYKGAPQTQTFTMHSPLQNKHIGLGLSVLNDKIGPINTTSAFADFAYIMQVTKKSKLSLGISGGVNILQARWNTLELDQQSDPAFQNNIVNKVSPNFGFGAYYSRERFYAGLSAPNIMQTNYSTVKLADGNLSQGKEQRHYFFIAGTILPINDNFAFKPTTLIKLTAAAPIEADLTASFIIMKRLLLGAMYRTGDSFGALVGFDVTQQLHVGYSYDWSYGVKTSKYNQGSHEIVLRYDFLVIKKQIHSPRYF